MNSKGANHVGRFRVKLVVTNNEDRLRAKFGLIKPDEVRSEVIEGVVDSGATRLVLPGQVVKKLGVPVSKKVKVRYADRRVGTRDAVEDIHVELLGRTGTFTAIVEPNRRTALIGAIVLEDLDFMVDCVAQQLIPRDPKFVVSEIE